MNRSADSNVRADTAVRAPARCMLKNARMLSMNPPLFVKS